MEFNINIKSYTDILQSRKLARILPLESADMCINSTNPYVKKAFHHPWYRIEQRYTLLFFIHWWGTPSFAPPHLFENDCDTMRHIKKHYPNAIVYDYYSENKCKQ